MKNIYYVENHTFTTANNYSVVFRNVITKKEKKIPFIDIEYIIFDHPKSYFSTRFILKCNEHNIGILFCNEKHIPVSVLYTEYNYHYKLKRLQQQIALPKRVKNRLWRKIIRWKIMNQALCVHNNVNDIKACESLRKLEKEVESNDRTYKEAHASRIYFQSLFGYSFKRGRYNDSINGALNYTYAIVRAFIRKRMCAHGFEPSIGIKHQSNENPFNLSDDFIETYRPLVDQHVYRVIVLNQVTKIDVPVKKQLIQILFQKCIINNQIHYISDAIKLTVESFISCLEEHTIKDAKLPKVIEGGV